MPKVVVDNDMTNVRMSDEYLDLDLLDEQARDILGQIRSDEVIIQ